MERDDFMKKLWKKVISILMISILSVSSVNIVWAQDTYDEQGIFLENSLFVQHIESMSQDEIDQNMAQIYQNLSDEARMILEEYMLEYDQDMLNYYEEVSGCTVDETTLQMRRVNESDKEIESRAVAATEMQVLGDSLKVLGLSASVYNALMAAGAEIAALATITLTAVVAILAVASFSLILYNNWGTVKGKWSSITSAFTKAFGTSASSKSAINNGFAQKETEQDQIRSDYQRGQSAVRTGTYDKNAAKHVDTEFVTKIRQNKNPAEIYYSSKRRVLLFVYKIESGNKANLNRSLAKNGGEYDLTDYNVSGFTMYVLVNPVKGKIFHCHLRRNKSDLEQFRNANQLDWRLKPTPVEYESKYTNATGSGTFLGNQTD